MTPKEVANKLNKAMKQVKVKKTGIYKDSQGEHIACRGKLMLINLGLFGDNINVGNAIVGTITGIKLEFDYKGNVKDCYVQINNYWCPYWRTRPI